MTAVPSWFHSTITNYAKILAQNAIESNQFTNGTYTYKLEQELSRLLDVSHCLYVNSGILLWLCH